MQLGWTQEVLSAVRSELPGIAVVAVDPDRLLCTAEVVAAAAEAGIRLADWDGTVDGLHGLSAESDPRPKVIRVPEGSPHLHWLDQLLPDHGRVSLSATLVARKLDRSVVRCLPSALWEQIRSLDRRQAEPVGPRQTALLLARTLFGVDAGYFGSGGAWSILLWLHLREVNLPQVLAKALVEEATPGLPQGPDWQAALQDQQVREGVLALASTDESWLKSFAHREVAALKGARGNQRRLQEQTALAPLLWPGDTAKAAEVLDFAHSVLRADAAGQVTEGQFGAFDEQFGKWLLVNYNATVRTKDPSVLCLHHLVSHLCEQRCGPRDRLLLVVLDAVGLATWLRLAPIWQELQVFGGHETTPAIASLPTLTSVSRLAIFEGKISTDLWDKPNKFEAEQGAWKAHPAVAGKDDKRAELFRHSADTEPCSSLISKMQCGVARLAVVDTGWDEAIHHLGPTPQALDRAIRDWAERAAPGWRRILGEAFANHYRVVVTADHGHAVARGVGLPPKRELAESWSRHSLLFESKTARDALAAQGVVFDPVTAPPGVFPLFARRGEAYAHKDNHGHSHGGLSLQEVLVPVAELRR